MTQCPDSQPPDIEELITPEPRIQPRTSRRTMTLQERDHHSLKADPSTDVRELLRNVSDANVVAFCTCQQSRDFPFCDKTHTIFNKATNSNISPMLVAFVDSGKCSDCGDKHKDKMDNQQTAEKRGCTITLSDTTNKLHISADNLRHSTSTSCHCNNKLSISTPDIHSLDSNSTRSKYTKSTTDRSRPSTPTITIPSSTSDISPSSTPTSSTAATISHSSTPSPSPSPSPSPTPSSSPSPSSTTPSTALPTPTPTPSTPTDTEESTETELPDKCKTKVYKPSSLRSPINKDNIITKAEVAEHNTQDDLWMIIKGNVYDITDYVQYHPGGTRALVKFAGRDGTENVHYHSPKMLEILNTHYFIGRLPKHEGGGGGSCIIS